MKISIEHTHLSSALQHVHGVVERRNTIPIISNVLLQADEYDRNTIKLVATDLEIEINATAQAAIDTAGALTVHAHTFYDIVRKFPSGADVSLEMVEEGARLMLKAGRSQFFLPCLPVNDFPKLEQEGFSHELAVGAAQLARLIDKTRFAVSTEETRYYLCGIYMHEHEGMLRCVATDGHRLALAQTAMPEGGAGLEGIIIPRKTVVEVRKLLDGFANDVRISVSETKIKFEIGATVLISKLIDGNFPDYHRVIPQNNTVALDVESASFTKAVDRVSTISTDRSNGIKVALSENNLALSAENQEHGHADEDLPVEFAGEELQIGFNARYLLDICGVIGKELTFLFSESAGPVLIQDKADDDCLFVIMPLRG